MTKQEHVVHKFLEHLFPREYNEAVNGKQGEWPAFQATTTEETHMVRPDSRKRCPEGRLDDFIKQLGLRFVKIVQCEALFMNSYKTNQYYSTVKTHWDAILAVCISICDVSQPELEVLAHFLQSLFPRTFQTLVNHKADEPSPIYMAALKEYAAKKPPLDPNGPIENESGAANWSTSFVGDCNKLELVSAARGDYLRTYNKDTSKLMEMDRQFGSFLYQCIRYKLGDDIDLPAEIKNVTTAVHQKCSGTTKEEHVVHKCIERLFPSEYNQAFHEPSRKRLRSI